MQADDAASGREARVRDNVWALLAARTEEVISHKPRALELGLRALPRLSPGRRGLDEAWWAGAMISFMLFVRDRR